MKVGDLVRIIARTEDDFFGYGIYLGRKRRHHRSMPELLFYWHGRIAVFDMPYWRFEVLE